jgi:NAD+ synthase (glutamine-hydrolysing)
MNIAIAQFDVVAGDPDHNVQIMIDLIYQAAYAGAELASFGEMCVGGYLIGDLYLDDDYCEDLMSYNERLARAARDNNIAVSFGNIYLEKDINARLEKINPLLVSHHPNKDGRKRRYNAVYVYDKNGEPAKRIGRHGIDKDSFLPDGITIKTNLPNYRFFDDQRYFFNLADHARDFGIPHQNLYLPFKLTGAGDSTHLIGFELCEDLWCEDYRYSLDSLNPTRYLIANGSEAIVNASSSPWTYGKNDARDRRVKFVTEEIKNASLQMVPLYYVNVCGVQNNGKNLITFDGGSTIYNRDGKPAKIFYRPYIQGQQIAESKSYLKAVKRETYEEIGEKYQAIVTAIKHFVKGKIINGVSGGVDSAVTTALYVAALGANSVIGVNMPSKFNKEATKNAAKKLCDNLGIRYHIVPIEDLADANRNLLVNYMTARPGVMFEDIVLPQLVKENLQAKIRAINILSNIAQIEGGMYSNNGNKVELAIGYFTLDADGRGSIAPLGDLTKEEVYQLGRYLNEKIFEQEIIPNEALNPEIIAPSAELEQGQYDPIKIGYHCRLVKMATNYMITSARDVMQWWLDGVLHTKLGIERKVLEDFGLIDAKTFLDDLKWFFGRERNQVFKRVQSVPIPIVSKTAYGFDRRESMLPPYRLTKAAAALEKQIVERGKY